MVGPGRRGGGKGSWRGRGGKGEARGHGGGQGGGDTEYCVAQFITIATLPLTYSLEPF